MGDVTMYDKKGNAIKQVTSAANTYFHDLCHLGGDMFAAFTEVTYGEPPGITVFVYVVIYRRDHVGIWRPSKLIYQLTTGQAFHPRGLTFDGKFLYALLKADTIPNPTTYFFKFKPDKGNIIEFPSKSVNYDGIAFDGKFFYCGDLSTRPDQLVQYLPRGSISNWIPVRTIGMDNDIVALEFDGKQFWKTRDANNTDIVDVKTANTMKTLRVGGKGICTDGKYIFIGT